MKNPYKELETALGYRFRNKDKLRAALTHRSFRHENHHADFDNQRLEFLGDAVLGLIAAEHLFDSFHDWQEGRLTKLRSCIASRHALAEIAKGIDLGNYLQLGRGEERSGGARRPSNLADALEAILGAAYQDGGLKAARKVFDTLFLPRLHAAIDLPSAVNPKGSLQEVAQRRWKASPKYRIAKEDGPAHSKEFTAEVLIHGHVCGTGHGQSKQSAEIAAARNAMESLLGGD